MGETTAIQWTDATWNPWAGCHKISAGCQACYMYREMKWRGQDPATVRRTKPHTFNMPLRLKEHKLIFTCSYSDFFIEEADVWRPEAWAIMRRTPHLTYQVLTKRPARIPLCLPPDWSDQGYPNVWLGVTVEDHNNLMRIPQLWRIPAARYFISFEPALGPVDWRAWLGGNFIDWLIAGCESSAGGRLGRPAPLDWFRSARDACQEFGVKFFLKQATIDGKLTHLPALDGKQWVEIPEHGQKPY